MHEDGTYFYHHNIFCCTTKESIYTKHFVNILFDMLEYSKNLSITSSIYKSVLIAENYSFNIYSLRKRYLLYIISLSFCYNTINKSLWVFINQTYKRNKQSVFWSKKYRLDGIYGHCTFNSTSMQTYLSADKAISICVNV